MLNHADKAPDDRTKSGPRGRLRRSARPGKTPVSFADRTPEALQRERLQELTDGSPQAVAQRRLLPRSRRSFTEAESAPAKTGHISRWATESQSTHYTEHAESDQALDASMRFGGTIQGKYVPTEAHGVVGQVNVTVSSSQIVLSGTVADQEVSGSVLTPEYKVTTNREALPQKVRDEKASGLANFWNPSNALRLNNINAKPAGHGLGAILAYEVAKEAEARGKGYVVALNLTDQGRAFDTHLGMTDYNKSRPYAQLKQRSDELRHLAGTSELEGDDLTRVVEEVQSLTNEMAQTALIIETSTLKTNAKASVDKKWDEQP